MLESLNYYIILDILLIGFTVYATIYSYKNKIYKKVFDYLKIFIILVVSAKYASYMGIGLQQHWVIKADTYAILILIGFAVNIALFYYLWSSIYRFLRKKLNSDKVQTLFAKFLTVVEVVIVVTFALYMVMQLYVSKKYLYEPFNKSYIYPKVSNFYKGFLNEDFSRMMLNLDSSTNRKEIILKSFKNGIY